MIKIRMGLDALQLAILFVPSFFLCDLLSEVCNLLISYILIPCILGILCGIVVHSASRKRAIIKVLISIPIDVLIWIYLTDIHFSVRSFHWIWSNYERQGAGDYFAGFILLCIHITCCLIGVIAGISKSGQKQTKKVIKITQKIICPIICVGIMTTIIVFNAIIPPYVFNFG